MLASRYQRTFTSNGAKRFVEENLDSHVRHNKRIRTVKISLFFMMWWVNRDSYGMILVHNIMMMMIKIHHFASLLFIITRLQRVKGAMGQLLSCQLIPQPARVPSSINLVFFQTSSHFLQRKLWNTFDWFLNSSPCPCPRHSFVTWSTLRHEINLALTLLTIPGFHLFWSLFICEFDVIFSIHSHSGSQSKKFGNRPSNPGQLGTSNDPSQLVELSTRDSRRVA